MCLLVFAWQTAAARPLVLAGNRDEFHDRPAAPAGWWDGRIVGGRDLRAGGTWLAAARDGRFAVVTNYREPMAEGRGPRSRGELVSAYLEGDAGPREWARHVAAHGDDYAGFNLLLGSPGELVYISNRGRGPEALSPGVYGLSNHLLDTPWPKVERTRARFSELLTAGAQTSALLELLGDRAPAAADELPDTGLPPEWEQLLSSPFIADARYGTRCSTVLRLEQGAAMELTERSFDPAGAAVEDRRFEFALEP